MGSCALWIAYLTADSLNWLLTCPGCGKYSATGQAPSVWDSPAMPLEQCLHGESRSSARPLFAVLKSGQVILRTWHEHCIHAGSLPPVPHSKPAGEKRRICATPVSSTPMPPQQCSIPAVIASTEARTGTEQPSQPPAPQMTTAPSAEAPAMQHPDKAAKSSEEVQSSTGRKLDDAKMGGTQDSAQQGGLTEDSRPACTQSAVKSSEASPSHTVVSHGQAAQAISGAHDSGEQLAVNIFTYSCAPWHPCKECTGKSSAWP